MTKEKRKLTKRDYLMIISMVTSQILFGFIPTICLIFLIFGIKKLFDWSKSNSDL